MGQYYYAANLDKMEVLCVDGTSHLGKLMDIAEGRRASFAILNQMAGPWRGDCVYLVGDYAYLRADKTPYDEVLKGWINKFHLAGLLYDYVDKNYCCFYIGVV